MKRCKTCKYRDEEGVCTSVKITELYTWDSSVTDEQKKDMLIYSYEEGGYFWVGEEFGCVHHEG